MTAIRIVSTLVIVASLAACSGTPSKLPSGRIDTQKVVTVNQWAEVRGAKLIWVHYPTVERVTSAD